MILKPPVVFKVKLKNLEAETSGCRCSASLDFGQNFLFDFVCRGFEMLSERQFCSVFV